MLDSRRFLRVGATATPSGVSRLDMQGIYPACSLFNRFLFCKLLDARPPSPHPRGHGRHVSRLHRLALSARCAEVRRDTGGRRPGCGRDGREAFARACAVGRSPRSSGGNRSCPDGGTGRRDRRRSAVRCAGVSRPLERSSDRGRQRCCEVGQPAGVGCLDPRPERHHPARGHLRDHRLLCRPRRCRNDPSSAASGSSRSSSPS